MLFTAACRPSPDKNVLGSPKAGGGAGVGVVAASFWGASAIDWVEGVAGDAAGGSGAEDSEGVIVVEADAAGVGLGCRER
jgi:hypothetical protein